MVIESLLEQPKLPEQKNVLLHYSDILQREGKELITGAIASGTASIVSVLITHPLDILKTELYEYPKRFRRRVRFRGSKIIYISRILYRNEGFSGFFKGHIARQRDTIFQIVSMFYIHDRVYAELDKFRLSNYPALRSFVSGFLSATFTVLALNPIAAYFGNQKRKKFLLKKYGTIAAASEVKRKQKISGLFRGSFPTFMYLGVQYGLRFSLYELAKHIFFDEIEKTKERKQKPLDPTADYDHYRIPPKKFVEIKENFISGALAGILSDVLSYPLEVVNSFLRMGALKRQQFFYKHTCRRYFQCIWMIIKRTKLRGLYGGFAPSFLKSMMSVGLQFAVYEEIQRRFEIMDEQGEEPEGETKNDDTATETATESETETKKPERKSWLDILLRRKSKVSVAVGDGLVNEEKKITRWERIFGEKKKKGKVQTVAKHVNSERRDKFEMHFQKQSKILRKEIIASTTASVLSTLISHPFMVVKESFQTHRYPRDQKTKRRSYLYWFQHKLMTTGLKGFYRGHWEAQRTSLTGVFSMFYTYKQCQRYCSNIDELKNHPNLVAFLSGLVSATIPVMAIYPIQNFKERIAIKKLIRSRFGTVPAQRTHLDLKTFRPLFHGCFSLFVHMGSQYGLRFFFYNKIREKMIEQHSTHDKATSTNPKVSPVDSINRLTNAQLIMAGGMAAMAADLATHPLELIYTRLQMSALKRQQYQFDHTCRTFGQCLFTILKHESILAFYSGLNSSMLRSTVNVAVQFAVYEKAQNWLRPLLPT